MKNTILFPLLLLTIFSCQEQKKEVQNEKEIIIENKNISFIDSLKSVCKENTTKTFDIEKLQTDDFSNMLPINEKLFQTIYPNRNDFTNNSFFIYSYIKSNSDYLTLITYQKNYEGEDYRVDYMDLINIDVNGKLLDKIRLTAKDNEVITYEVVSDLKNDSLIIKERISSELYSDMDTLYINEYNLKLNNIKRVDTINIKKSFEIRKY